MISARNILAKLSPLLACLGLLAAWQVAALWFDTESFPTAWHALRTVPQILGDPEQLLNILDSIRRMVIGFSLAVLIS